MTQAFSHLCPQTLNVTQFFVDSVVNTLSQDPSQPARSVSDSIFNPGFIQLPTPPPHTIFLQLLSYLVTQVDQGPIVLLSKYLILSQQKYELYSVVYMNIIKNQIFHTHQTTQRNFTVTLKKSQPAQIFRLWHSACNSVM